MAKYSETMKYALAYLGEHGKLPKKIGGRPLRSSTLEALQRRGAIDDKFTLTSQGEVWFDKFKATTSTSLAENIDQPRSTQRFVINFHDNWRVTFDIGETNHLFWDKARRGDAEGLEIAGLFLKPLSSKKAAWVMGQAPKLKFEGNPDVEQDVNQWFRSNHADVVLATEESANLGDMYIVVNPDLSLSLVPPHVVKPIVDEKDYSNQLGWKVTQVYQKPDNSMDRQTIEDEFLGNWRVRTIKKGGKLKSRRRYRNPLGKPAIVHIPNNLRANEKFGHPEGEALLKALWQYNEIFTAAIEGNIKQGRPVAVFEKMGSAANLQNFMETFGVTKTALDENGEEYEYIEIDFSDTVALGDTGTFDFKSPGSFTTDTKNLLGLLFYLIVQHSEMPEFIFGNAIQGSRASAETQLPPFVKWIEKEQGRAAKWLRELIEIVVAMMALADMSIESRDFAISWPSLSEADGQLSLNAVQWAYSQGLLTDEVALHQLGRFLDIEDAATMLDDLQRERDEQSRDEETPFVPSPEPTDTNQDDNSSQDGTDSESEIVRRAQKALFESEHSGAMVAFEIDLDTAASLVNAARQAGLDAVAPEELHITLAYMPERDEGMREDIEGFIQEFVDISEPIKGKIGGIGRFNASEFSDGMDVIYASFDAPGLPEFRQALVEALEDAEAIVANNHGFTPHITLAYVEKNSDMLPLFLETIPLTFEAVTLYWGDERVRFNLKQDMEEKVVVA